MRCVYVFKYICKYRKLWKFFFFYKIYFEGMLRFKMKNSFIVCFFVDDLKNVIYFLKCVLYKVKLFVLFDFIFI